MMIQPNLARSSDEGAQTPFELFRDKSMRDELSELLEVLDDRERKIICKRFGLDGGKPKTLEEVGKNFGVTRAPGLRPSHLQDLRSNARPKLKNEKRQCASGSLKKLAELVKPRPEAKKVVFYSFGEGFQGMSWEELEHWNRQHGFA